jgi:hypothetical protein
MKTRNPARRGPLTLALATFLLSQSLDAQEWIELIPGTAPGTPAQVLFDPTASTETTSFFDIEIPGFWVEDVKPGDGNTYQRVDVPGLGHTSQVGAPDLPVARLNLATAEASSSSAPLGNVILIEEQTTADSFFDIWPYPVVIEEQEGSENPDDPDQIGTPEQFVLDSLIYGGTVPYPPSTSTGLVQASLRLGSIPSATHEIKPFQFDPTTGKLQARSHMRLGFRATGFPAAHTAMSHDKLALAAATFDNWPAMGSSFPLNSQTFEGRYLIVTPEEYLGTLDPFIDKKTAQGFLVSIFTLEELQFVSCGNIRGAMADWYDAGDPAYDHYALLVGESTVIPLCPSPTLETQMGDDLYGSPSDGDLDEEIYVGRLSVDNASELTTQIDKILAYMEATEGDHYDNVLLVADEEGAPGKYVGAHESVANANYAVNPDFTKVYGHLWPNDDDIVKDRIHDGQGVVAYRGHGSSTSWSTWNSNGDSFSGSDVDSLTNASQPSVVWAFNCWNSRIQTNESIAELWMDWADTGVAAHYGSTEVSSTSQNHELDRAMFEAVFHQGITRHGQAIAWAEAKMNDIKPGWNSWMYMLLGDPSMRIRRTNPEKLGLVAPSEVATGPNETLTIQVQDAAGYVLKNVMVTSFQTGGNGGQDKYVAEGFTDSAGFVVLPAPTEPGALVLTASDFEGNETSVEVAVTHGAWTDLAGASTGSAGQPSMLGTGSLIGGSLTTLDVTDAAPAAPALMFLSFSSMPVPFKGVLLQAFPIAAQFNLGTDAAGEIPLAFPWPNGLPAGAEIFFQTAIADAVQPLGVSITNAVKATTP